MTPLERAAESALRNSSYHDLALLTCRVRQGRATLQGTVRSFYLKQLAQERLRKLDGIQQIVNRIVVCPSESAPPKIGYRPLGTASAG